MRAQSSLFPLQARQKASAHHHRATSQQTVMSSGDLVRLFHQPVWIAPWGYYFSVQPTPCFQARLCCPPDSSITRFATTLGVANSAHKCISSIVSTLMQQLMLQNTNILAIQPTTLKQWRGAASPDFSSAYGFDRPGATVACLCGSSVLLHKPLVAGTAPLQAAVCLMSVKYTRNCSFISSCKLAVRDRVWAYI